MKRLFVLLGFVAGVLSVHAVCDNPTAVRASRTFSRMALSTAENPQTVRILFYGQSIVAQNWGPKYIVPELKKRYPTVRFVVENRALGGYESPVLIKTANADIYPFYPDLLFFHVYGPIDKYAEIVRRVRERTTADVILWTSHLNKAEGATREKIEALIAHPDARSLGIRATAEKYACMFVDLRTKWCRMLLEKGIASGELLADGIHMKSTTLKTYADMLTEELPFSCTSQTPNLLAGSVTSHPPALKLSFTGNRVVAYASGKAGAEYDVYLDGKPVAENPHVWAFTRTSRGVSKGSWPLLSYIKRIAPSHAPETWTLEFLPGMNAEATILPFKVTGSVTGEDGCGVNTNDFVSRSGKVCIARDAWPNFAGKWGRWNYLKVKPVPGTNQVVWSNVPLFTSPYAPSAEKDEPCVLVQNCVNGPHVLELRPRKQGPFGFSRFEVYAPARAMATQFPAEDVRTGRVTYKTCEKCPYRMRLAKDGLSATINEARLKDDSPLESILNQRKKALEQRARMLMTRASDVRHEGKVRRPLMGWSSWNTFGVEISEDVILSTARCMVTNGLMASGYRYVNIDDGFFNGHGADGRLRFHPRRFPNGMKGTVDGIHALGLKAGIYSDAGSNTCANIWSGDAGGCGGGLYGHDKADFTLHFNELGFDFIKVDYCGARAQKLDERVRYGEIAAALRETGRTDARLNLCRWAFPGVWAADIAESWRTTRDIRANWKSVKELAAENYCLSAYVKPGHYNDLDMLEVGHLKGKVKTVFGKSDEGFTPEEERAHFGLWCMLSSPLLLGCDVRHMSPETLDLVTNPFLLSMNQNDLGLAAYPVRRFGKEGCILVKDADKLFGNARFVTLFNADDVAQEFTLAFAEVELGGTVALFDLAERVDMGERTGSLTLTLPAHSARFLRLDAQRRLMPTRYGAERAYLPFYQELEDAQKAKTAFYALMAEARGSYVVRNAGGRAGNDIIWKDVRTSANKQGRLNLRVKASQSGTMFVQVNQLPVQRLDYTNSQGKFVDVSLSVEWTSGVHTVRVFNDTETLPEIESLGI